MTLLVLAAASPSSSTVPLWAAVITALSALGVALVAYIQNRRKSDADKTLGVLTLGQQSLVEALNRAEGTIKMQARQLERIPFLEGEIQKLRLEVQAAIRNHEQCERERADERRLTASLRRQLEAR